MTIINQHKHATELENMLTQARSELIHNDNIKVLTKMSWHKLNNSELQACRKLLMLDVSEAAELIGNVSNRTWQYWESGRSAVPADVDEAIYAAIQRRNDLINEYTQWQVENDGELLEMSYYHTFDQYAAKNKKACKLDWRIHQSAVAFVFSEGGEVELV